jgi:hypothetical protein
LIKVGTFDFPQKGPQDAEDDNHDQELNEGKALVALRDLALSSGSNNVLHGFLPLIWTTAIGCPQNFCLDNSSEGF